MIVRYRINYSLDGEEPQELYHSNEFPSFADGWKYFKRHIEWLLSDQKIRVAIMFQTQKKMEIELKAPWHRGPVGTGVIEVVDSVEAGLMCGAGEDLINI